MIDFSVIIPQRNSIQTLPRLFDSIPLRDNIEIILVDNTPNPVTKEDIGIEREYKLCWSKPERCAGGARNVGMENAKGKWLIFADADDYFADGAFDTFSEYIDSEYDAIFFTAQGIIPETGELTSRGDICDNAVRNYLSNPETEMILRTKFSMPWAKMIRRSLVLEKNIKFEEILASNDIMFSALSGYYAKQIAAVDKVVYMVTTTKGSLTRRRGLDVLQAKYGAELRRNAFFRSHGLSSLQSSVMYFIIESLKINLKTFISFLILAIKFRQNIFIGCSRWGATYLKTKRQEKKEKKFIVHY